MTDQKIKQIREFRLKEIGYKAIESVTGLSRDIVRNYCKANGLDGHSEVVPLNLQEKMKQAISCMNCGKDIDQPSTGRKKKYCSAKCRRTFWKNHAQQINRKETAFYENCCVYCGDDFKVYGNKYRKYCSHGCYVKDRFWREEGEIHTLGLPKMRRKYMSEMKWQSISVGDLKPSDYNPRKKLKAGDKEYEKIKNSILVWLCGADHR